MQTHDRKLLPSLSGTIHRRSSQVILRLWGCTDADVERAEANALQWHFNGRWEIVEVLPSTGTPCPIPIRDPIALHQNAMYDAAWAVYPVARS